MGPIRDHMGPNPEGAWRVLGGLHKETVGQAIGRHSIFCQFGVRGKCYMKMLVWCGFEVTL